ncbi:MAG: hypothetical protein JO053_09905 [Acidobacteria bacterium]|nr:hypothetical protein [Acidobacteriota bacterium]
MYRPYWRAGVCKWMRLKSETSAIQKLSEIREEYRERVSRGYEFRAKDCKACETPGACCLDAHFVNVRITRLEARAMRKVLDTFPPELKAKLEERIEETAEFVKADGKFACPLYERESGCLVHHEAKPIPCISHGCYERVGDLPPTSLQDGVEASVDLLNTLTYGKPQPRFPIPIALRRVT